MPEPILELKNLQTYFPVHRGLLFKHRTGTVKAVDGVSLAVRRGEVLGLVGESGCGKSTLARTILQLVPATAGSVVLEGRNLTAADAAELQASRRVLQMVFQDPYGSLNPRLTVFATLAEPMLAHKLCPRSEVGARVAALMKLVGLAPRFLQKYPHEFSGGQRQRIAVARALALQPKIIIADEPVSALDVSVGAQILELLAKLRQEFSLTLVLISHSLPVVAQLADHVAVMQAGDIVESGTVDRILQAPQHPYTQALLASVPQIPA